MDKPTIGIRQADGSFYEIMGDSQTGRKRLVLSAARTDQHGVRIDLYRSTDGTCDPEGSLGTIALDDPEGLGYQDIEFRVDLGSDGMLDASATLPGQPPRKLSVDLTPFRGGRTDHQILGDESFASADLDTLDDSFSADDFGLDTEAMTLDLPENEEPRRSDADILADENFASVDLDSLDDFSFEDGASEADGLTEDTLVEDTLAGEALPEVDLPGMDFSTMDMPEMELPAMDLPSGPDSFDLGDLDAGFGDDPLSLGEETETPPAASGADGDWEKISFDDMESMEFLDTGDEISKPKARPAQDVAPAPEVDSFSMDHDDTLDLGDYDSDLSDLPDMDGPVGRGSPLESGSEDDFDQDFLPPPELTETPLWDADEASEPAPRSARPARATKEPKAARQAPVPRESGTSGGLDRTALILSLATLSLLVLLILVLLFLNMIKAPVAPAVQPEVMRWKPLAETSAPASWAQRPLEVDLAAADPVVFEAGSVLEVPAGLGAARVALRLGPGDTAADAARRFGDPARSQGNLLSW